MSNKKQTPVEQFAEQLASKNLLGIYTYDEMVMFEDLLKHSKEMEKEQTEMYKECLEQFVPIDKWDNATKFLSTYGSGLAKDFSKNETYGGNK